MFLGALGTVFVADQLTKAVIGHLIPPGQARPTLGPGRWTPMRLRHVQHGRLIVSRTVVALCLAPMVVGAALLAASGRGAMGLVPVGLGLAAGGSISNALDVLRGRPVIDFVDVRIWPVFNVADAAITVGVVLSLLGLR